MAPEEGGSPGKMVVHSNSDGLDPPADPYVHPQSIPRVPVDPDVTELKRKLRTFKSLSIVSLSTLAVALIFIIALSVPHGILWRHCGKTPPLDRILNVTTQLFTARLPVTYSGIGAATLKFSYYFSPRPDGPQTKVVYNNGDGTLCIRTISESASRKEVGCVKGTNARIDTPLTMLDWVGGPSIYFLTNENFLSGIDYIRDKYKNGQWKLSPLITYKVKADSSSQLASLTWLNGTAAWIHYQDPDKQIREFGVNDFRGGSWYNGSTGPLGPAVPGSGIGASRWLNGTAEAESLFFQVASGVVYERQFTDGLWLPDKLTVKYSGDNVPVGASISAATVSSGNSSMILLSYVSQGGLVTIQTRETMNTSEHAYSPPKYLQQDSERSRIGLAVVDSLGVTSIYIGVDKKIVGLSSNNVTTSNWTIADI